MFRSCILVTAAFALLVSSLHAGDAPDLVLNGELTGRDHQTYREVPFLVPAGVARITVEFSYTGKEAQTTVDLGLLGPDGFHGENGFRGWSGGNKNIFTVSATDATPSYLAGPILPGKWSLLLGIPNIRKETRSDFTAQIYFSRSTSPVDEPEILHPAKRSGPGWYRGDLHLHSAHSDGYVRDEQEKHVPAPLYLTVEYASKRGLDFIFLTDHNTVSQADAIRELQPYFDRLLLIPGYEVTTFQGHANVLGLTQLVDFRVGSSTVPDWNAVFRQVKALHGFISINHPIRPSGETCLGCGWTPTVADLSQADAVEIVNGLDADTPFSGVRFWQEQLAHGFRLVGVGGSDNHNIQSPSEKHPEKIQLGAPVTVVYARELSAAAILEGLHAGHVFVDVMGSKEAGLEFEARLHDRTAMMGDSINVPKGATVSFAVKVSHGAQGGWLDLMVDGQLNRDRIQEPKITKAEQSWSFTWESDGGPHWLQITVRGADGKSVLISNPIYVNR